MMKIEINKNQLPNMREDGSVENTEKYALAEYEYRGFRLRDLAERIASQLDSHFILYDYKGNIYTDNEDVIQILIDQYPSGTYEAHSMPENGFSHDNLIIEVDRLLKLQNDKYEWFDYQYIEKWHSVYRKLALHLNKLSDLFSNKSRGEQLYEMCFKNKEFRENNRWIDKFKSKFGVESLDPIHVFASFNSNKLVYKNRVQKINILFKILDKNFKQEYKDINFDGCPAPMIVNIIGARNINDQKEVWDVFQKVMMSSQSIDIDFESIKKWFGIDIGSFTIFLFWIDANNFLPLDKYTEALLKKYRKLEFFPKNYVEYKKVLSKINTNLYRLLASIAIDGEELNRLGKEDKSKVLDYLGIQDVVVNPRISGVKSQEIPTKGSDLLSNFRLIAIKPLTGCAPKYLKTLKENEYYTFDKTYAINDDIIEVNDDTNLSLFDLPDVKLNINAIVGKNGTGKSTIVELLFALINNLSFIKKLNKDIKKIDDDLHVELIYGNLHIYKILLHNESFTCEIYDAQNKKFVDYTEFFKIEELFYTIAVNYSQHSFNSIILGDWIHSLFHKNDSYKTPIVIEPYRNEGNIDINRQERLIKQRLLSNLLEQEDKDDIKNSPRQLTEFYRATHLELTFNLEKLFYKTDTIKRLAGKHIYKDTDKGIILKYASFKDQYKEVLTTIYRKYALADKVQDLDFYRDYFDTFSFNDKVNIYIFKKILSIAIKYERYNKYFDVKNKKFKNIEALIEEIYQDKSHITYKLKQAIYFLKFNEIIKIDENKQRYSLEDLSDEIHKIRMKDGNEQLTVNELIPPSFFDVDIILENDINFNTLSSGEKQKIFSVNSILYHLNNINSVDQTLTRYQHANIVLDEIELYFHPELQRQYLAYLRHAISKANTNNILAINILFVTHSPFILSDIPDTKILFLDKKDDPNAKSLPVDGVPTFGANIHELLINGFFMKNSIGDFALEKIKSIVDFYYKVIGAKEKELQLLKEEYDKLKNELYFIQQHIGEKYIADIIKNHIEDIEKTLNADDFKKKKIEWLEQELKRLKGQENQND